MEADGTVTSSSPAISRERPDSGRSDEYYVSRAFHPLNRLAARIAPERAGSAGTHGHTTRYAYDSRSNLRVGRDGRDPDRVFRV